MKKLLLATAVAALSVSAQAAPQVYGKVFLTVDSDVIGETKTTTTTETYTATNNAKPTVKVTTAKTKAARTPSLNSRASRIGFKGSEALTDNTDVVYKLEYRLEADSAGGRNFESRDTYLGLANKQYGTVMAGRLTAIDGMVDYANVAKGPFDGVGASFDAPRVNDAFAYVSPNYSGLSVLAMYGTVQKDWGVAAKYEPKGQPFKAGASYVKTRAVKAARVSGSYDASPNITVGGLYQLSDYNTQNKENALTVSAEFATETPWKAYAQLDMAKNVGGVKNNEGKRAVVGGMYEFNKATTGHVYAGYSKGNTTKVSDKRTNGAGDVITTKAESTGLGVGAGLEYKF
ncbi:outer membrane porin M35 [Moraxella macacae 0408225]|uniref:Outer membrane porin M35 n=1 Tax=Moraxella macacae 0408225 TaxID=1230338 RepID=L2F775_9GAMM|nr:porin [Moraxella macacae]ELA08887.1 outer membrane porin M35 [Moraxella macacae 0408225]